MRQDNDNPLVVLVLIALGLVSFGVWTFSRSIGADFQITLEALERSVGVLVIAGGIWYYLRPNVMLLGTGTAAALWPCWWAVLDSIANNHAVKQDIFSLQVPADVWWNTNWFLYSVEALLVVAAVYLIIRPGK